VGLSNVRRQRALPARSNDSRTHRRLERRGAFRPDRLLVLVGQVTPTRQRDATTTSRTQLLGRSPSQRDPDHAAHSSDMLRSLRSRTRIQRVHIQVICSRRAAIPAHSSPRCSMSFEGPVGTYVNPGGHVHQLLTLKRAHGVRLRGHASSVATWFPGYEWRIAFCEGCGHHLGWRFAALSKEARPQHFWALRRCCVSQDLEAEAKRTRREQARRDVASLYPDVVQAHGGYQSG
jgi:hypothetical protein